MGKLIRITKSNDGISTLIRSMTFQVATWREITHYTADESMLPLSSHFSRPVSVKSRSCFSDPFVTLVRCNCPEQNMA
jgi:hypothetical protein